MGHGMLAAGGWTYLAGAGLELAGGRLAGRTTRAGAFLGSAVDRVAELLVLGGLATTFRDSPALLAALAAAGASMLVSYARARGEALGAGEAARGGSFQRLERTAGIGLPCALAPLADAAWGPGSGRVVVAWGLAALAALTALSAGRRTTVIYRTLRAADPAPADRAPSRLARALRLVPARSRKAAR
jgi:phosphatidylglycerophosphate synthase